MDTFLVTKSQQSVQEQGLFIAIVGDLRNPEQIYTIIGGVKYICQSVSEALNLAVKIYLAYDIPYPTKTLHAWIIVQKLVLRINKENDKLRQANKKALSFFLNDLGIPREGNLFRIYMSKFINSIF